jgi:hypothetical protein
LNKTGEEDSSSEEEEEVKEEEDQQRDTKVKFADDVAVAE